MSKPDRLSGSLHQTRISLNNTANLPVPTPGNQVLKHLIQERMILADVIHQERSRLVIGHPTMLVLPVTEHCDMVLPPRRYCDTPGNMDFIVLSDLVMRRDHGTEAIVPSSSIDVLPVSTGFRS